MRSFCRYLIFLCYPGRVASINRDDLCWRRDIDEECFERRVIDRPTGTTGYFDFGDSFSAPNVDDRCCIRIRDCRITDVGNDQKAATRVECDAIRLDADADLESVSLIARRKH